jgi:hypothetical protein
LREEQGGKIFVVDVPVAIDITTNKRGEERRQCNAARKVV